MTFEQKLQNCIQRKNSLLCVGLDTVIEKIPEFLRSEPEAMFTFNKQIIEATADFAAAYKVNTAFYEAYGSAGWRALEKTFSALPNDVIKIADAKRGDIGNTSTMYSRALFDCLGADAITVNPLLGTDSINPFLIDPEKGVFFLCLTSNPGSADFQRFSDGKIRLYEKIALYVNQWNSLNNCGLVVGATHPDELIGVRKITNVPFLIPGIGAQKGDVQQAVQNGTDKNGGNALFNSSRAIIYASSGHDFALAARREAKNTCEKINTFRKR
ncbi:orotidine-5'-phosphate decarboxylase [candidate division KSB1 bacterium]|nr:orotidine-5'-phosphate decarboxylase [candidate division KSB1 bacterium]